jgi:hypothetical protein
VRNTDPPSEALPIAAYPFLVGCTSLRSLHIKISLYGNLSEAWRRHPLTLLQQVDSPVLESVQFSFSLRSNTILAVESFLPWQELIEWFEDRETLRDLEWKLTCSPRCLPEVFTLPQIARDKFAHYGPRSASIFHFVLVTPQHLASNHLRHLFD